MEQLKDIKCVSIVHDNDEPLLMKSKLRVQKHGEVFTPQWVVDKMLSIPGIKEKAEDIFATFLEPSAGEGAFLLTIEKMKLQFIIGHYNKEQWSAYALWALTSIYGIEFLEDNLVAAQQSMLDLFAAFYEDIHGESLSEETDLYKSARTIIKANIVQGNTLTHRNQWEEEITFSRWTQVPDRLRMVERTTFTYSSLFAETTGEETYVQGSLFDMFEQPSEEMAATEYAVVDIEQVWREEKENG
ncbi:MAG: hypothetical protein LBH09_06750 [Peptococcaceae bacterium]|jgi:hypothetical protein|nr:hypothetical protein [Peptococcaceae bacterium]